LIAGGSIAGILYAVLFGADVLGPLQVLGDAFPYFREDTALGHLASGALFLALAVIVVRAATRKVD
jgi:hypothetical protein